MEMKIHFAVKPQDVTLREIELELADLLEDTGWPVGAGETEGAAWIELELEEERNNPKHAILAVKHYCQEKKFPADTDIELAGTCVGIYE